MYKDKVIGPLKFSLLVNFSFVFYLTLSVNMYAIAPFKAALLASLVSSICAQLLSADLVGQLRNAPTAPQRLALLKDSDVRFLFLPHTTILIRGPSSYSILLSPLRAL
jgi:hypothetical protein